MSDVKARKVAEPSSRVGVMRGDVRKPYVPPAIESESVFETSSLACGKLNQQGNEVCEVGMGSHEKFWS